MKNRLYKESGGEKINIGLLLDSPSLPNWAYCMLEKIKELNYVNIGLIVLNDAKKPEKSFFSKIINNRGYLLYKTYIKLEAMFFKITPNAFESKDVSGLLTGIPVLRVKPRQKKYSDSFEEKDIDEIKKYGVDLFIRLGFRILRGRILDSAPLGIWSFHHADNQVNRGGPPGFWEVLENHPVTGSVLQILTEDLDEGLILCRSYSATDPVSITRNRNQLYWKTLSFVPRKLNELHTKGKEDFINDIKAKNQHIDFYCSRLYREPQDKEFIKPFLRYLTKSAKYKIDNSLLNNNHWSLMFRLSKDISTSFWKFERIMSPKGKFWADPHIISKNGKFYIYFEEFEYSKNKGHISFIEMDLNGNYSKPVKIIEKPYHLSYPFVFEWKGDLLMIPESSSNKTIEAYKCIRFPDKWAICSILMKGLNAVDTTLFCYQGKWWLFTNIQENEGASILDELFLFYSDNPLGNDWKPHPKNPIVSDARSARPAGKIFEFNGRLYRPSQDCSRGYGYGLKINQILLLNEEDYQEQEADFIKPRWSDGIEGVHTFSHENGLTVIDVKSKTARYL